jgi:hypothetical protein
MTDLAVLYQVAQGLHAVQKAIRQIDGKKSVRAPGRRHSLPSFSSRPSQGFLTKHMKASVSTSDGLGCMKGTWRGNHDAIERPLAQELVEALAPNRLRRQIVHLLDVGLHGLDDGRHLDTLALHQGFQA